MKKPVYLDEKFNRNVLGVVCLVGLIRVILEFNRNSQTEPIDFYLDLSYGVIFILTLIGLITKSSYKVINLTFYIPLVILLCLTLIDRKGLASSTENNIHVGLIVITLTMRGADARKFSILLIIGAIISLIIVEYQYNFLENYTDYSTSHFNFIFMGLGTILVMYYAKSDFERGKKELTLLESNLSNNQVALDTSNSKLESQTLELEKLNKELENKVEERVAILKRQRQAVQEYLQITMEELDREHRGLNELTSKIIKSDDEISRMILESSSNLKAEMDSLMGKLKSER